HGLKFQQANEQGELNDAADSTGHRSAVGASSAGFSGARSDRAETLPCALPRTCARRACFAVVARRSGGNARGNSGPAAAKLAGRLLRRRAARRRLLGADDRTDAAPSARRRPPALRLVRLGHLVSSRAS